MEVEDQQHNRAFGEHTGITEDCRDEITCIKNNDPSTDELSMIRPDADEFTDLAWRLLGRYIANNTHLEALDLADCGINDEKMALLFRELTSSTSMERLDIDHNEFGVVGVRSIVPLLQNSPNLTILYLCGNDRINSECFDILVSSLHDKEVWEIDVGHCNISDISALETYSLPNLQILNLDRNNIGREGCIILSNRLQQEGSTLSNLNLTHTGMGDDDAELLATSLENNIKLNTLDLRGNSIAERGERAFLELLVDVSSVQSTYNSNHTLTKLWLPRAETTTMISHIDSAVQLNKLRYSSHAAGRGKVIEYQLDSQTREEMCRLQGIECSAEDNMLADVEPKLLPNILILIGREHGQSELYTALLPVTPDLLSFIDRKAMIIDEKKKVQVQMKELSRQLAALADKDDQLNSRLASIELGDSKEAVGDEGKEGGDKRQRII